MQLFHNSHDTAYRMPFGAAATGSKVKLALKIISDTQPDAVKIRLWENEEEIFYDMAPKNSRENQEQSLSSSGSENTAENEFYYTATVPMPEKEGLVWYYFIVETVGKAV